MDQMPEILHAVSNAFSYKNYKKKNQYNMINIYWNKNKTKS